MKQEIQEMLLIIFCGIVLSGVVLFYLQRKFVFSTLRSEVEELQTKKQKLIKAIHHIKLQTAQYSSIHRINQLLPEEITSKKLVEQKIFTLTIPRRPSFHAHDKKDTTLDQIIQYEYSPADNANQKKTKQK